MVPCRYCGTPLAYDTNCCGDGFGDCLPDDARCDRCDGTGQNQMADGQFCTKCGGAGTLLEEEAFEAEARPAEEADEASA